MIHSILSLIAGLALSATPHPNTQQPDSIKNKQIKEITVLGGLSKTLVLPAVVVDAGTLQAGSYNSPADALQRETGISLTRDGIWATSVNVRGLSEQRLLFMVDGDRIQTAADIAGALSTVDMNSLEKIEVVKGASSVLYGTGAMGGVVNFVSLRPTYTISPQFSGKIGSEFNSANSLWANSANLQFSTNQWYLTLTGSYRTAQNMNTPEGKLANSQFNDASWGLRAGIMYSPNEEFLVNYQHAEAWDVGLPGGIAFPATATVRYKEITRNQLSGEYIITNVSDALSEIRLKAYTQNISRDVENKVNPTTVILPGSFNRTSGAKVTTDWDFTNRHKLLLGAETWVRQSETARVRIVTTSDTTFNVIGEQPTPNAKMFDLGVFAHYSWKAIPQKLTLNAGLRLDYIRTENDSAFNPLFRYSVNKGVKKEDATFVKKPVFESMITPEFSYATHFDILYNPTRRQQLALSVANSYRAASIEERFKYIEQGSILRVGDPELRPEKGTFSNLNYTLSTTSFRIKMDIFANYLIDLITEKQGEFISPGAIPRTAFINTNVDKALFVGAEMETFWLISSQLSFLANASYTRARDVTKGTFLPQIPPLHGFVSIDYAIHKKFKASLSALWAARQSELAANETSTAGHIIYNFAINSSNIKLPKSYLQLFAGVDNILNTAYMNHLSTTRGILRLEPGRNVYVKAKLGW
jgi:hemoglobin/transferrin/lactoferrin receptor protein